MDIERIKIEKLAMEDVENAAELVANFRVELKSYKGIIASPNLQAGKDELLEYLCAKYPVFVAKENGEYLGYIVCRIEEPCVWVESLFVSKQHRRKNIASALFKVAEDIASSYGEETVYNYVHPNNDGMISFLKARGYNVLNLIEIRKPYIGEQTTMKIRINNNEFDY